MSSPMLEVKDIRTAFHIREGVVPAVDGVSLYIHKDETLAVVGESGCGKSVTALSIMRLIKSPPGKIERGEIIFDDKDLLKLSIKEMREIRGNDIGMIFQEPMTSLNPVYTIGDQIAEAIVLHQKVSKREARTRTVEMLRKVEIPLPERRFDEFPHQLSGGMRQRVMIAMALSCNPKLLIADEPTTALDVTIQAQILDLMRNLRQTLGMSIMLITHDLGVVASMADRVVVMYAGKVVEEAPVRETFKKPMHPYTHGLLDSIPHLAREVEELHVISGTVPNLLYLPEGCRFGPRCPYVQDKCRQIQPTLVEAEPGHKVSCWYPIREARG
ncbi:MAG: Oligopeptide transport ATP-binding protein OppD [Firmicutes bacterium]|nr:Oligopeptide transport ATP-binding protein OppD [Bacillota bacterium]